MLAVRIEQRVADDNMGVEAELDGEGMERRGTTARHVKNGGNGDTVRGDALPEHVAEERERIRATPGRGERAHHDGPGDGVAVGCGAEEGFGGREVAGPGVAGEHAVEGEGVLVGHLVEQGAGAGEAAGGDEGVEVEVEAVGGGVEARLDHAGVERRGGAGEEGRGGDIGNGIADIGGGFGWAAHRMAAWAS